MTRKVSRKEFLKTALASATAAPLAAAIHPSAAAPAGSGTQQPIRIENSSWQLNLAAGAGLNAELIHSAFGLALAQGEYSYNFGPPAFELPSSRHVEGTHVVALTGHVTGVDVQHTFRLAGAEHWVEEQITLTNRSQAPLSLPYGRCGFVLPLTLRGDSVEGPLSQFKFVAVPYRREPGGNRTQYADYTVAQVLRESRQSELRAAVPVANWGNVVVPRVFETGVIRTRYPYYASEGWVLTDGRRGFLITKYSLEGMEWALVDRVPVDESRTGLRWGGFGIFEDDPEPGASIPAGESYSFGATRITAFQGGVNEGFYTFRREMESRGHGCPKDFNPPVHWNELYDNKLWWLPDSGMEKPANRAKYYTIDDLRAEALKARDIGCEALYLDPGWDTNFASKIWDEQRLGPLPDFTAMVRREYGLSLSLHTPLSGWCDPSSYSREIDRMNRDGTRIERSLCGASRQYVEETHRRLAALASGGARFLMFDGTMRNGDCWDPAHGHPVPSTRHDHVESTNELARLVHEKYPEVLIEMHDQVLGGTHLRYVPAYYGHGPGRANSGGSGAPGFDSIWAFELMWDPMTDLVGGHSIALYYFNLAYSLPLYIHIDLRKDNAECLMFWWNASTCRHLGIGGSHADPAVRRAQKDAMAAYREHQALFKRGIFYGIDEMTHVHADADRASAVINCFNLEDHAVRRSFRFEAGGIGLDPDATYRVIGASAEKDGRGCKVDVELNAYGHTLVQLQKS